jgi:hypothetical protein
VITPTTIARMHLSYANFVLIPLDKTEASMLLSLLENIVNDTSDAYQGTKEWRALERLRTNLRRTCEAILDTKSKTFTSIK